MSDIILSTRTGTKSFGTHGSMSAIVEDWNLQMLLVRRKI